MMKWLRVGLFIFVSFFVLSETRVCALEAGSFEATPQLTDSPVIITAYSLSVGVPEYVELFNSSSQPINLSEWRLEFVAASGVVSLVELDSWIAPSNYIIVADASVDNADFSYELAANGAVEPKSLRLVPSGMFASHEVAIGKDGYYQRKISTSTGNYLSTFETTATPTLYGGGFYDFPQNTPLRFSEILANPKTCSPLDESLDCEDYAKIYNPSSMSIDLSKYRLRVGYKGQTASSSNTYKLSGEVQPGHFAVLVNDIDGKPISITNSGGFVWLEDTYGVVRYDETIQSYEDASASSKKGQAWAYDSNDGMWKWTTHPTPDDAPSTFPTPVVQSKSLKTKTYAPCKTGQYRSPETNRCRNISSLTTSSLKPCLANQYRSPETNRCRNFASAATSSLKPCAPGQERNPATNRCRKSTSDIPQSAFSVEPVADAGKAFAGWWALGGVGTLAVGYGIWEWRHEALGGIRKIGTFFTSSK